MKKTRDWGRGRGERGEEFGNWEEEK